jgi:hypothetical protein
MSIFGTNKINPEMVKMISPTSRASLKTTCLLMANCDIDTADRLYEYFTKDMPEIPPYETQPPTFMDSVKTNVNGFLSLIGEHKDSISQGYEVIRAMFGSRSANVVADVEETAEAVESDLPPIS